MKKKRSVWHNPVFPGAIWANSIKLCHNSNDMALIIKSKKEAFYHRRQIFLIVKVIVSSTNDPENVHLVFLLVLDTKTAGRVWSGERGDWLPGSDRLESFAQCSQWSQWSQMSPQTKLSASLPTTWKLGKFLNDTKHHKMLHISFSPEKYQVRSSLLCYMNSENPRTRLRFSSNSLIWEFYFLAGIIYWYYLHHFLHIKLLSMVSYGNILKSDNHHFITHQALSDQSTCKLRSRQWRMSVRRSLIKLREIGCWYFVS